MPRSVNVCPRNRVRYNQIEALDRQIFTGNTLGAANFLQNAIRGNVVRWLADDFLTPTPRQYTKDAHLRLVDDSILRLNLQ